VDEEAEIARGWAGLEEELRRDLLATVRVADRIALRPATANLLPAGWTRTQVWAFEGGSETPVITLRAAVQVFIRDAAPHG
jgi:hypothetical protein